MGREMLTLSGANTYSGGTFVRAGTLQITSDAQLGAVPGSPAINLTLAGGQLLAVRRRHWPPTAPSHWEPAAATSRRVRAGP